MRAAVICNTLRGLIFKKNKNLHAAALHEQIYLLFYGMSANRQIIVMLCPFLVLSWTYHCYVHSQYSHGHRQITVMSIPSTLTDRSLLCPFSVLLRTDHYYVHSQYSHGQITVLFILSSLHSWTSLQCYVHFQYSWTDHCNVN